MMTQHIMLLILILIICSCTPQEEKIAIGTSERIFEDVIKDVAQGIEAEERSFVDDINIK